MNSVSHREERGPYMIEAGAQDLGSGSHWKPWLKLALLRRPDGVFASRTFDGLKPVFATQEAALRYATELARGLVDEGSELCPAAGDRKPARWLMSPVPGGRRGCRLADDPATSGLRFAAFPTEGLAGIFARGVFAVDIHHRQQLAFLLRVAGKHT